MRVCFCSYFTGENRPAFHGWSIILSVVQPKYMLNLTQQKCHWPLVISDAWIYDFSARQRNCGKVIFQSCLSVILFTSLACFPTQGTIPSLFRVLNLVSPQICSNLFNLACTRALLMDMFKLDMFIAQYVGKLAVGILLKCLLVSNQFGLAYQSLVQSWGNCKSDVSEADEFRPNVSLIKQSCSKLKVSCIWFV